MAMNRLLLVDSQNVQCSSAQGPLAMQRGMPPHRLPRATATQQTHSLPQNMASTQRAYMNSSTFVAGNPFISSQTQVTNINEARAIAERQYKEQLSILQLQQSLQKELSQPIQVTILNEPETNTFGRRPDQSTRTAAPESDIDKLDASIPHRLNYLNHNSFNVSFDKGVQTSEKQRAVLSKTSGATQSVSNLFNWQTSNGPAFNNSLTSSYSVQHQSLEYCSNLPNTAQQNGPVDAWQKTTNQRKQNNPPKKTVPFRAPNIPHSNVQTNNQNNCNPTVVPHRQQLLTSNSTNHMTSVGHQISSNSSQSKLDLTLRRQSTNSGSFLASLPASFASNKACELETSVTPGNSENASGHNISPGEWIDNMDIASQVYVAFKLIEPFDEYEKKFIQSLNTRKRNFERILCKKADNQNSSSLCIDLTDEPDVPLIKSDPRNKVTKDCSLVTSNAAANSKSTQKNNSITEPLSNTARERSDEIIKDCSLVNSNAAANSKSTQKNNSTIELVSNTTRNIPNSETCDDTVTLYSDKGVCNVKVVDLSTNDIFHSQSNKFINKRELKCNHSEKCKININECISCSKKRNHPPETTSEVNNIKKKKKFDERKHGHLFDLNLHQRKLAEEPVTKNQKDSIKKKIVFEKHKKLMEKSEEIVPPLKLIRRETVAGNGFINSEYSTLTNNFGSERDKSNKILTSNNDDNTSLSNYVTIHQASFDGLKEPSETVPKKYEVQQATVEIVNNASKICQPRKKVTKNLYEFDMFEEKKHDTASFNYYRHKFNLKPCGVILKRVTLATLRKHNVSRENILHVYGKNVSKERINQSSKIKHCSSPLTVRNTSGLTQFHTSSNPSINKDQDHNTGVPNSDISTSNTKTMTPIDGVSNSREDCKTIKPVREITTNVDNLKNNDHNVINSGSKLHRVGPRVISAEALQKKVGSSLSSSVNYKKHTRGDMENSSTNRKSSKKFSDKKVSSSISNSEVSIKCLVAFGSSKETVSQTENNNNNNNNVHESPKSKNAFPDKSSTNDKNIIKTPLSVKNTEDSAVKLGSKYSSIKSALSNDGLSNLLEPKHSIYSINAEPSSLPSESPIGRIDHIVSLSTPYKIKYTENPSLSIKTVETSFINKNEDFNSNPKSHFHVSHRKQDDKRSKSSLNNDQSTFNLSRLIDDKNLLNKDCSSSKISCSNNSISVIKQRGDGLPEPVNIDCQKQHSIKSNDQSSHSEIIQEPKDPLQSPDRQSLLCVNKCIQQQFQMDAQNQSIKELNYSSKDEINKSSSQGLIPLEKALLSISAGKEYTNSNRGSLNFPPLNVGLKHRRFSKDDVILSPSLNEELKVSDSVKEKIHPQIEEDPKKVKYYMDNGLPSNEELTDPRTLSLTYCGLDVRLITSACSSNSLPPNNSLRSDSDQRKSSTESLLAIHRFLRENICLKMSTMSNYTCYSCYQLFKSREEWGSHSCLAKKI